MVVRVDRTPSRQPSRSRRICDRCSGSRARTFSSRQSSPATWWISRTSGTADQRLGDARFAGPIGGAQGDEGQQPLVESFRVELRRVGANHSAAFELAQPLEHGRGRQPHDPGDFSLGDAGVVLKEVEDLKVDCVEHWRAA